MCASHPRWVQNLAPQVMHLNILVLPDLLNMGRYGDVYRRIEIHIRR
jgi:hypothetical protein